MYMIQAIVSKRVQCCTQNRTKNFKKLKSYIIIYLFMSVKKWDKKKSMRNSAQKLSKKSQESAQKSKSRMSLIKKERQKNKRRETKVENSKVNHKVQVNYQSTTLLQ